MSEYSTLNISRKLAISTIISKLYNASDTELEDILFDMIGQNRLYNFSIVSPTWAEDDELLNRISEL